MPDPRDLTEDALYDRVARIIEAARSHVSRLLKESLAWRDADRIGGGTRS